VDLSSHTAAEFSLDQIDVKNGRENSSSSLKAHLCVVVDT
jgi:hypothetical protein